MLTIQAHSTLLGHGYIIGTMGEVRLLGIQRSKVAHGVLCELSNPDT